MQDLSKIKLDILTKELGISKTTAIQWKKRSEFFPLGKFKTILKILGKENYEELERNIFAYGTKKSKLYIKSPLLPIKDSPELREILIHIMCDGCYNKENGYAAYYNVPIETKEEFVKELKTCFGEIDYKIYKDHVHFPTVIALILKRYFNVDFNSKRCRVPEEFFKGERRKLIAIIRAAIIDEGTIDGGNIRIDSCNRRFLEDLKQICKKLGYESGKTWESKGPIFRFNILSKSLKQIKEDLGDLPIKKKQSLIELAEKNQRRGWKYKLPGEVKIKIIKELLNGPERNIELILKLNYSKSSLGNHLRWLIKKGLVNKKIWKNITTYFIKNKKEAEDFMNNPSSLIKSGKINNYGISQLKVLKFLEQNNRRYSEIEKYIGIVSSATFKLISSLKNKELIEKTKEGNWGITENGKNILKLDKEKARYILYANVKSV
ncbi:MAG: ArsR family transcriptional regulator [Nanoarchaeota archaeon]|nr:ArsR family transcriptional regulator [Nanoarchaeota archaeon]